MALKAMSMLCSCDVCQLVLRAEVNMVLLGHSLSLLLQTADQEAAAGDRGSRTLRGDALRILDQLMSKARCLSWCLPLFVLTMQLLTQSCFSSPQVDDGDALAFFVPGIISGLCKSIYRSTADVPGVRGDYCKT